jgi:outer membrane receptor for ferrienterochelin and colicin
MLFELTARIAPGNGFNLVLGGGGEKDTWGGVNSLVIPGTQTSSFFYAQADYRLDPVKLIGGLQYNKLQDIGGNASPRLGAIWDFTPEWGAKLLYSTAFRKGYPNETGFNVSIFHGNPDLQPELIATTEGQVFYQGKAFQGSLTVYHSQMKDIIIRQSIPDPGSTPPFYLKYVNGGTWDYDGVEFEGRWNLSTKFMVTASASYETNETGGVDQANLMPTTQVKAGALYQDRGWSFGLFDVYSSASKATASINPASAQVNPEPGAYHLVSAKVTWKVWSAGTRSLTLAVESNDLLDRTISFSDYPNKEVDSLLPLYQQRTVDGSVTVRF